MDPNLPIPKKAKKVSRPDVQSQSLNLNIPIPKHGKYLAKNIVKGHKPSPSNPTKKVDVTGISKMTQRNNYGKSPQLKIRISKHNQISRENKAFDLPRSSHIRMISERPLVLQVSMSEVLGNMRSSSRSNKRKSYIEKETYSDFLDSDSEDEKKVVKKLRNIVSASASARERETVPVPVPVQAQEGTAIANNGTTGIVGNTIVYNVESPPPGTLPSLWYSRECCIHVWVIEKIIGWKQRRKVEMEWKDENIYELDRETSRKMQDKLINHSIVDPKKRIEISRISPRKCPIVLQTLSKREQQLAAKENRQPGYFLKKNTTDEMEEVLLIKWRGRSYIHCSWERASDLDRLDPTNNTAKGKVKRYYQTQHTALGMNWKKSLVERRKSSITVRSHGLQAVGGVLSPQEELEIGEEEFFPSNFLDVERIIACDEKKVDLDLLSRQRELNTRRENEADIRRRSEIQGQHYDLEDPLLTLDIADDTWDPEDYVRYVVKWKGLQVSEVTWEYWLHIKHECVDQTEHFWRRQQAPDPHEFESNSIDRPHMRDYKKLLKSPTFGIPSVKYSSSDYGKEASNLDEKVGDASALRLRDYQLEGVNWLIWNWWNKRSCILSDEMGLGKTIQAMALLDQLQKLPTTQVRGPFLIVAPLSLVSQWQSEAKTWAPDMNIILYHGSMDARSFLAKQEFFFTDQFVPKQSAQKLKRLHVTKFHALITTYEVAMKDISILSKIRWKALIVDEAHRLKNNQSRLFKELLSLRGSGSFCLLLTGTPLQNSTEELWSLLHFCDSSYFASKEEFVDKFGQLNDSKQVQDLHSLLKPYLLRRVKEDVAKNLPPKEETILEVALTPTQKKYYKAIYERNTSFLFKGSKSGNAPSLMNIMMELRKCCNHPFLINGAEDRIIQEAVTKEDSEIQVEPMLRYKKIFAEQLVQSSGKMVLLMKLLPKLQSGGHKILIFSQMVKVLNLLEELLKLNNYSYERLDGSTRASARNAAVERFNDNSYKRFVMLLSTRAGGLGLNLTSADTVIIFDSDWNPQNDLQAMSRAHRIGQTRAVKIYRILTVKTYEMHMFHSASMKLGLDRAVLAHQRQQGGEDVQGSSKKVSKESQAKEIDELLKKGAYDVFKDDDDADAKTFLDTDIDQILERSSRKITHNSEGSSLGRGLGSFSKASFVTSDADGQDIDLDDPDFWAKAIGLDAPISSVNENILFEKRNRKQVQVFDHFAAFEEEEKKEKAQLKEGKDRLKQEKRLKRDQDRERKKKDKDKAKRSHKGKIQNAKNKKTPIPKDLIVEKSKGKKISKDFLTKKFRRSEDRCAMRSLEQADPVLRRMRQEIWNTRLRDSIIRATLLYGFGRFCKVRYETSLVGLPLQDIEVFTRSYILQLGVQAAVSLLRDQDMKAAVPHKLEALMKSIDGVWVAQSIMSAIKTYDLICDQTRELRIPRIWINDDSMAYQLQDAEAIASLKDIAFMNRFNAIIEDAVKCVLSELGEESLGKRGCYVKDISTLDLDMKVRYVTTEELKMAIGERLSDPWKIRELSQTNMIASFWDRSCDIGLILGTFLYGLRNYQPMISQPFIKRFNNDKNRRTAFRYQRLRKLSMNLRHAVDKLVPNCSGLHEESIPVTSNEAHLPFDGELVDGKAIENDQVSKRSFENKDIDLKVNTPQEGQHLFSPKPQNIFIDLSLLWKKVKDKDKLREVITADPFIKTDEQSVMKTILSNVATKLDNRLFQLVSLIDTTESCTDSEVTTSSFQTRAAAPSNKVSIFNRLCNALKLEVVENNLLCANANVDLDSHQLKLDHQGYSLAPGTPRALSQLGLMALSYVDGNTIDTITTILSDHATGTDQQEAPRRGPQIITPILRNNCEIRNAICAAFLCLGTLETPQFMPTVCTFSGLNMKDINILEEDVKQYIHNILIPHCAAMCLSVHPNPIKKEASVHISFAEDCHELFPFPDPCRPCEVQSQTSIYVAISILRRCKIYEIISNATQQNLQRPKTDSDSDLILDLELKSAVESVSTGDFPVWWNNDCSLKLLLDIARHGLFYVLLQLQLSKTQPHSPDTYMETDDTLCTSLTSLNHGYLEQQIKRYFFQGQRQVLNISSQAYVHDNDHVRVSQRYHYDCKFSQRDIDGFIKRQISTFPDALVIETFLVQVCSNISQHAEDWSFVDLPMPDHAIFRHEFPC